MPSPSNALASLEPDDCIVRENAPPGASNEPSLSWRCGFPPCRKLRVHEGGSRFFSGQLEWCSTCECAVVVDSRRQETIIAAIDQHLL
jgi:hypothetical protein